MVDKKRENKFRLNQKEQATTATYKLLSEQNDTLKKSLKKTQDELEKMREEKSNYEKKNAVLEHKQSTLIWIEIFKFLSATGVGFSANYLSLGNYTLALSIGLTSIFIYVVSLIFSNK